jgi:hypothetical protein
MHIINHTKGRFTHDREPTITRKGNLVHIGKAILNRATLEARIRNTTIQKTSYPPEQYQRAQRINAQALALFQVDNNRA